MAQRTLWIALRYGSPRCMPRCAGSHRALSWTTIVRNRDATQAVDRAALRILAILARAACGDARAAIAKGFPPARLAAISAAANATVLRAERLLNDNGKWSFNTPGGFITLPAVSNVTSRCVSSLMQGASLAAHSPSVMYVDYFEPPAPLPGQPPPPTTETGLMSPTGRAAKSEQRHVLKHAHCS